MAGRYAIGFAMRLRSSPRGKLLVTGGGQRFDDVDVAWDKARAEDDTAFAHCVVDTTTNRVVASCDPSIRLGEVACETRSSGRGFVPENVK